MDTITRIAVSLFMVATIGISNAQEVKKDSLQTTNKSQIEALIELKSKIEEEERKYLKQEIENINERLDNKDITAAEAEELKSEAAEKRAANIENRLAIVDNKIALLSRNDSGYNTNDEINQSFSITFGDDEVEGSTITLGSKNKPKRYDRRTYGESVFAIGFNNTLIDGQSLEDSPYKLGGSGFVEWGYTLKTRLFNNSNFWRLKYGLSVQWNKLDIKDNNYFVNTDGNISLEQFPVDVDKAKFRTTNLVIPVHLEFGPSRKIEREDYFRYSTDKKLKIGLGGYAGLNINTLQKIKYEENDNRIKSKQRGGYEVSTFVYGLSGYIGLGEVSLYVKYDLNPLFNDQVIDQNNISVGIRFDTL